MTDLDACEAGTVTPLCTAVAWWPPDPAIGNPWVPVPANVWIDPDSDYEGSYWPPFTPGTCQPDDVEDLW